MNQDGEHLLLRNRGAPGWPTSVAAAPTMPLRTGSTASRWLGLGGIDTTSARGQIVATLDAGTRVVAHVAHPPEVDAPRARERILELARI